MKKQYWKNGIMMGLIDEKEAQEIIENAKNSGYYYKDYGNYIIIETVKK